MFDQQQPFDYRRWLPHAVAAACLGIVIVAGTRREELIRMLPFGIAERVLDRDVPEQLKAVFPSATAFSKKVARPIKDRKDSWPWRTTPEDETLRDFRA